MQWDGSSAPEQSRARKGAVEGSQCVGAATGNAVTARLDRTLAGAALFRRGEEDKAAPSASRLHSRRPPNTETGVVTLPLRGCL